MKNKHDFRHRALKIEDFKKCQQQKTCPKIVILQCKKKLREIRMIFDVENLLWKSEIGSLKKSIGLLTLRSLLWDLVVLGF